MPAGKRTAGRRLAALQTRETGSKTVVASTGESNILTLGLWSAFQEPDRCARTELVCSEGPGR